MPQLTHLFDSIEMRTYASPADAQLFADADDDATAGSLVLHFAAACTMATSPPISLIMLDRPDHATGCACLVNAR